MWQTFRHSDGEGLGFLDMTVGDFCLDHSDDFLGINMCDLYLEHHGIKGQKWGQRRYQNEDGSLTSEGISRYLKGVDENQKLSFSGRMKLGKEGIRKYEEYNRNIKREKGKKQATEMLKRFDDGDKRYGSDVLKNLNEMNEKVRSKTATEEEIGTRDHLIEQLANRINKNIYDMNRGIVKSRKLKQFYEEDEKINKEISAKEKEIHDKWRNKYTSYSDFLKHFKEYMVDSENDDFIKQLKNKKKANKDNLYGQVLKELGFQDTPENRKYMYMFYFFD